MGCTPLDRFNSVNVMLYVIVAHWRHIRVKDILVFFTSVSVPWNVFAVFCTPFFYVGGRADYYINRVCVCHVISDQHISLTKMQY